MKCIKCNISNISLRETKKTIIEYRIIEYTEEKIEVYPKSYELEEYELICECPCGATYPIQAQLVFKNMKVEIAEDTYDDEEYYTLYKETSINHLEYATKNDFII